MQDDMGCTGNYPPLFKVMLRETPNRLTGHFRVAVSLIMKARLSGKLFIFSYEN